MSATLNAGNMLCRQSPRNRRIADACAKCGLVERSGQGANRMFEESIKEGRPRPDFTGTDDYQVELTVRGEIQNPAFLSLLQKIGAERLAMFGTRDILVLDAIRRQEALPEDHKEGIPHRLDQGIIERIGGGRCPIHSVTQVPLLSRAARRLHAKEGPRPRDEQGSALQAHPGESGSRKRLS